MVVDQVADLSDDFFALGSAGEEVVPDLGLVFLVRDHCVFDGAFQVARFPELFARVRASLLTDVVLFYQDSDYALPQAAILLGMGLGWSKLSHL